MYKCTIEMNVKYSINAVHLHHNICPHCLLCFCSSSSQLRCIGASSQHNIFIWKGKHGTTTYLFWMHLKISKWQLEYLWYTNNWNIHDTKNIVHQRCQATVHLHLENEFSFGRKTVLIRSKANWKSLGAFKDSYFFDE